MKGILLNTLLQCVGLSKHDYMRRREEVKGLERRGRVVLVNGEAGRKEYVFIAKTDIDEFLQRLNLKVKDVYQNFYQHSFKDFRV